MKGFTVFCVLVLLWTKITIVYSFNVEGGCVFRGTEMNCVNKNLTYIPAIPSNVTHLVFTGNFLPTINKSTFRNISNPKHMLNLNLRHNHIVTMSNDSFNSFSKLRFLDLSENQHIENDDLKKQLGVLCNRSIVLVLNSMGKYFPHEGTFSLMDHCKFGRLSVWRNNFVNVSLKIMQHFDTIQELDFSHNSISDIQFANMERLNELILRYNDFDRLPNFCTWEGKSLVPKLKRLYMSSNFIHKLHSDHFKCLSSLMYIDLSQNYISFFPNDMLLYLPKLQVLLVKLNGGRNVQFEKYALRSKSLRVLQLGMNGQAASMFPSINDTFKYAPKLENLDLSLISMLSLTSSSFYGLFTPLHKLTKFTCFNCKIIYDPSIFLGGMHNLTKIDLGANLIEKISPSFLSSKHYPNLRDLRLEGNKLVHLTPTAFPVNVLNRLEVLELYGNPYMCDCTMSWFIDWLKTANSSRVRHKEKYKCASPPNYAGQKLLDIHFSYFECHPMTPWMWALSIGVPTLIVLAIIAIIVYRNRWNIKHFMYLVRKRKNYVPIEGDELLYDAFVSYNQRDSDWVVEQLIPKLENEHNCTLCIHERDFHVGAYINDNIVQRIEESKRMILILSDDFATSGWCMFELKIALSKHIEDDFELIVVLLHMIKAKHLNGSIKTLLEMTTYLEWTEDAVGRELFWNKLTNSIYVEH